MRSKSVWLAVAVAAGLAGGPAAALAEEISYRGVTHNTAVSVQPVPDVEGHVMGVARFSGLAFLDDGRVGTTSYVVTFDYVAGNGPWLSYHTLVLDDGSTLVLRIDGTSRMVGARTELTTQSIAVVGGTGTFAGATGSAVLDEPGWRIAPMAEGGDTYYQVTVSLD